MNKSLPVSSTSVKFCEAPCEAPSERQVRWGLCPQTPDVRAPRMTEASGISKSTCGRGGGPSRRGVPSKASRQVAVDLLTGVGRSPDEGEALVNWMKENERNPGTPYQFGLAICIHSTGASGLCDSSRSVGVDRDSRRTPEAPGTAHTLLFSVSSSTAVDADPA